MNMKQSLLGLLGARPKIASRPDPKREYTPERLTLKKQVEETAILRAEDKRLRRKQKRQAQQERLDAAMWWRKINSVKQWYFIREYWPKTWPYSIHIGHIVYMFRQVNL